MVTSGLHAHLTEDDVRHAEQLAVNVEPKRAIGLKWDQAKLALVQKLHPVTGIGIMQFSR